MPSYMQDPWEEVANPVDTINNALIPIPQTGFQGAPSGFLGSLLKAYVTGDISTAMSSWLKTRPTQTQTGGDRYPSAMGQTAPGFFESLGQGASTGFSDAGKFLTGQPTSQDLKLAGVKGLLASIFSKIFGAALSGNTGGSK